jgi:hypothetical protein
VISPQEQQRLENQNIVQEQLQAALSKIRQKNREKRLHSFYNGSSPHMAVMAFMPYKKRKEDPDLAARLTVDSSIDSSNKMPSRFRNMKWQQIFSKPIVCIIWNFVWKLMLDSGTSRN